MHIYLPFLPPQVMTTGMLIQRMLRSRFGSGSVSGSGSRRLHDVGMVILDEFHERNMDRCEGGG